MNDLLIWKERTKSFAAEIKWRAEVWQWMPPSHVGDIVIEREGYMNARDDFEQMLWLCPDCSKPLEGGKCKPCELSCPCCSVPMKGAKCNVCEYEDSEPWACAKCHRELENGKCRDCERPSAVQNLPATPAPPVIMSEIQNKGTGAGGANTNVNGKGFEKKTDNEARLLQKGFVKKHLAGKGKYDYYLEKDNVVYLTQGGLKKYMKQFHKVTMIRSPDEAYLVKNGDEHVLKILEKKNQNVEGSVADKLQIGDYMQYEYECCLGEAFASVKVDYAFCISDFLKKLYTSEAAKYKILREYNKKNKVTVLFGDDEDYFAQLDKWISA